MNETLAHKSGRFEETSETDLRAILDQVSDCYLKVDADFRISAMNAAAAHWVGQPVQNVLGKYVFDVFTEMDPCDRTALIDLVKSREKRRVEISSKTHPGCRVEADFLPSGQGTTVLFRDVTDRKAAELAGEKARDLLNSALDATSSEIAILDEEGRVLVANRAWHRFMADTGGYLPDNGIGEHYLDIRDLHPVKPQLLAFRSGIRSVLTGETREFGLNFRTKVRGGYRSYRLRASRMEVRRWRRTLISRDDVTELETALHDVDNLAVRLVNLQEQERQRYAAELHDSTVQHLTAASLNLTSLRDRMPAKELDRILEAVEESVSEAQREIRSVSYLLYPQALDQDGLRPTLSRFASGYSDRTGIAVNLRISGTLDGLPLSLKRTVLRIIQEAMANVHRHAHASAVHVGVAVGARRISLGIADDGIGIARDVEGKLAKSGVGISGMRARAHQFGGCLKIRSSGKGTVVFVRIPLSSATAVLPAA
jgi:PAS domain S-box-containing protein